jgi:uncharacterized protein (DUF58 family)
MGKILDAEFMNKLDQISLKFNVTSSAGNFGTHRSKSKGSSVEFSDYREYIAGDDFRRIDWNALARFERVFVKLFMEERESPVTVFLDKSESMGYEMKKEMAIKVATIFIYTGLSQYNSVSTVLFDETIYKSENSLRGKGAFNRMANLLEDTDFSKESNLYESVYRWQSRLRKGVTILVSDLMYEARLEEVLKLLHFKKQKVILCHIVSENELNPVFEGNVRLIDSESSKSMDILARGEAINIYKRTLEAYIENIKKTCSKYHVDYMMINSQSPIDELIVRLQKG